MSVRFEQSEIAHSNLGGGGPDYEADPTILIRNVGYDSTGQRISLKISNLTHYRPPLRGDGNGNVVSGTSNKLTLQSNGTFGSIGLQTPTTGTPSDLVYVELRFTFVDAAFGLPVHLDRTFFSFYDFDTSSSQNVRARIHHSPLTQPASTLFTYVVPFFLMYPVIL